MCSCDQSLVTPAFLWENLSQPQFYKDLTRKTTFFEGWSRFKFNNLGLAPGTNLKFYTSVAIGLKLKVRKSWGLIPTFVEVAEEKLVGGGAFCPPILNWVKVNAGMDFILVIFTEMKFNFGLKNTTRNEMPTHVHQNIRSFWNAAEMKLHVNRTCFHAGLKCQTGMSSFRLSCQRTLKKENNWLTRVYYNLIIIFALVSFY